jgi:hypothetical protein
MNEYYPDSSDQQYPRQGKLVLPAHHDAVRPSSDDAQTTSMPLGQSPSSPYRSPVSPDLLAQHYASSAYVSGKLRPRTGTNPAQLILLIAIIVVLIATGSVAYAAVTVLGPTATKSGNTAAAAKATSAALNARASATALAMATPTPSPTMAPTAIPTFDGGPLKLTIEDLPHSVNNGDSGPVTVQTNASGISVHLEVTYDVAAPPYKYTSDTQVTDASGVATLTWNVEINPTKRKTNAQVVAITQESNGQQIESEPVNVRIYR